MPGHPHFSSALTWHTSLDAATADAVATNKRLMLVVGRQTCGGTRALIERTLSKEELEDFTPRHFALLAADADALDPRIAALISQLPVKSPTPLIAYLSTDARILGATAGGRPPAVLLNDMLGATSKK